MRLHITIPTEAQDVRLEQFIEHGGKTWIVDEVIHRRNDSVSIVLLSVGRGAGRRKRITVDGYDVIEVLPSLDQVDVISAVIDAALHRTSFCLGGGVYVTPVCEVHAETDLALLGI